MTLRATSAEFYESETAEGHVMVEAELKVAMLKELVAKGW